MRQICLDTETTGLSKSDDRVVEIGCVEIDNFLPTGRTFHCYINPKKPMPREAEAVHGISSDFLRDKPIFRQILPEFLRFIGDTELVIHNAPFDMGMLNAELARCERPPLKNPVVDTMVVSRKVRPGKSHRLDAICRDYKIDLSRRTKHGALLDAEILASAYLHLEGGEQYVFGGMVTSDSVSSEVVVSLQDQIRVPVRPHEPRISPEEFFAHNRLVAEMGEKAIWNSYLTYANEDVAD